MSLPATDLPAVPATPARGHDTVRRWALFLSLLLSGGNLLFPRAPLVLAVIVLVLATTGFRLRRHVEMRPVWCLLGAVLALALVRPITGDPGAIAVRFANFFIATLLLRMYLASPPGSLARDLFAIGRWFAIQALATVALATVAEDLFLPVVQDETVYRTVLLILTYHVMLEDAVGLIRPDGFFYEPGVFHIYLNLYLYLALFEFRSRRQAVLATLAVLATQSTTGLLICLMLLGANALRHLGRGGIVARAGKLLLALLLLAPVGLITQGNVVDKLTGEARGSSWAREYDLLTGLNVIAEHPLLGVGFDHGRYRQVTADLGYIETELSAEAIEGRGNTNGIVYLVYAVGIPLALPFLFGMFRQRFFRNRWLIGLLLFLSLLSESIVFTPFFLMLTFSGLLRRPRRSTRAQPAGRALPAP